MRQHQQTPPRKSVLWRVGVAILLVGLTGFGLVWWRSGDRSPPHPQEPTALLQEPPASAQTIAPDPDPAAGSFSEQQAEVVALKQEAVAVASEVASAYPDNALSYALLGSAYYNTGQSEEAARYLRRCLELNPAQIEAYEILARMAYERGELEIAEQLCRDALQHGPPSVDLLNQLGRALLDQGRAEETIEILQEAIQLPQSTSESHYLLGQACLQSGRYAKARESFQQAVTLLPDHTQAFFGLYTASMRLGDVEAADRYREQFLQLEAIDRRALTDRSAQEDTLTGLPFVRATVARTFFGAGQIYRFHDQTEKAVELFGRAAGLDSETPVYGAALEALYVQRNALADGVNTFQQLASEQPQSPWNHFFLGRLHDRLKQVDAAEQAYGRTQHLAPAWAEGYRALADLYLRANRKPAEALALARKAAELEPNGPHYHLLAVACMRNHNRAAARAAMEQAVALNPDEARYRAFLDELNQEP